MNKFQKINTLKEIVDLDFVKKFIIVCHGVCGSKIQHLKQIKPNWKMYYTTHCAPHYLSNVGFTQVNYDVKLECVYSQFVPFCLKSS